MDNEIKEGVKNRLGKMEIKPAVKDISMKLTMAADELINLLRVMQDNDPKMGLFLLSTVIAGMTLTLTDNVDEALGVLRKAREQIVDTEKEVNVG